MMIPQNIQRKQIQSNENSISYFHHQLRKHACVYTCLPSPLSCYERPSGSVPQASSSFRPWTSSPFLRALLQLYHLPPSLESPVYPSLQTGPHTSSHGSSLKTMRKKTSLSLYSPSARYQVSEYPVLIFSP